MSIFKVGYSDSFYFWRAGSRRLAVIVLSTIFLFFLSHAACVSAASFDCGKAGTAVEKMICADPELSQLDEVLWSEYRKALNNTSEPIALKHKQKQWLKEREVCSNRLCIKGKYSAQLLYLFKLNSPVSKAVIAESTQAPSVKPMKPYVFNVIQDTGGSVCRDALSNMSSFSPTQEQIACGESINFGNDKFHEPNWKELPLDEHWEDVYEIDNSPNKVRGREIESFEKWKKKYRALIEDGQIRPRLRSVVLRLPVEKIKRFGGEGGESNRSDNYIDVEFFGYTRNRNNVEACKKEIETGVYRGLKKYTGDRISYFASTRGGFEYLSSDSTFSNPKSFYDAISRLGHEENLIIYDSVPYLVSASPFRPEGYKYYIKLFRIFSSSGSGQGLFPAYAGQYVCTIEASSGALSKE